MNPVLLKHYQADTGLRQLLKEIRAENYPLLKQWKPQESNEENMRLLEEIKFSSAQQQGFDLLYRFLTGE